MAATVPVLEQPFPERPFHQRKQSTKSQLFKALVSPVKTKPKDAAHTTSRRTDTASQATQERHDERQSRVLGERASNMRSPPRSKSCHTDSMTSREHTATKSRRQERATDSSPTRDTLSKNTSPVKKDTSRQPKEKENTTPRSSTDIDGQSLRMSNLPTRSSIPLYEESATPRANNVSPRKISDSSTDAASPKKTLSIMKRGARVMAAVAAIQSKSIPITPIQEPERLDPVDIEARFEAMLGNRNVPPAMREKMRNLTLRMKADLVKQEQDVTKATCDARTSKDPEPIASSDEVLSDEGRSTKRSRPRSRTFTFSRSDRHADDSPSKKQRGRSRSRPAPVRTNGDASTSASGPSTPRRSSVRGSRTENPADYIDYLKKEQDPTKVEVGRLHKLRILLRNETVAWVNKFIVLDGFIQITSLLDRIMAVEWREDHEDQLLHETLLCLKGLCTTESALKELSRNADTLFPALLAMLFDEEKKGPAEYSTRAVIINILFAYLSSQTGNKPQELESRARAVLTYLSKPKKNDGNNPLEFVLDMQTSRPYKLWCRELTNVTREVFWIFLHQVNVIPSPKSIPSQQSDTTFTARHFPGLRAPVPAAPYIGGVEWDATTYITGHLDLLNGLTASLPTREARNELRKELQASGFEKTMGVTLRTCKEKFYGGVHDGLRAWVAAAVEDNWPVLYVCEGPTLEEQAKSARSSPKKGASKEAAPKLEEIRLDAPKLDLGAFTTNDNDINGWLDA